jgi:hypothetical protein
MSTHSQVRAAKRTNKELILSKPNVVGVAAGYKMKDGKLTEEVCVVALVRNKVPAELLKPEQMVPTEVSGVATDVWEVGELRALQTRTEKWRPAPPGVSIGHYRITAGTFGCVVRDIGNNQRLILSNNHVLADENEGEVGDPILQPGPADGGQAPGDTIATLLRYIPIQFDSDTGDGSSCLPLKWLFTLLPFLKPNIAATTNLVDAAVAAPLQDDMISDEILEIGEVRGITSATLGMAVRKSGRTTGLTSGQITLIDATVQVTYSASRTARFENQILTSGMSQGGDSGSLLVAANAQLAVGLLFAGSDMVTIYNPIQVVLDMLRVHL